LDFQFGASVRVAPAQTDAGSNIVQKGRFDSPGGQWKLQVDGKEGYPSCVLQGEAGGERRVAVLTADLTIADNEWHHVSCTRGNDSLTIAVDGTTKSTGATLGRIANSAVVRIAAAGPGPTGDQFHGDIDVVSFCVPGCE
jgi:hypothetical protein